jgi:transposase-like protein
VNAGTAITATIAAIIAITARTIMKRFTSGTSFMRERVGCTTSSLPSHRCPMFGTKFLASTSPTSRQYDGLLRLMDVLEDTLVSLIKGGLYNLRLVLRASFASIQRIAESLYSRKPLFTTADPYPIGPMLSALSPRSRALGAGTLIYRRIKIRSRSATWPALSCGFL